MKRKVDDVVSHFFFNGCSSFNDLHIIWFFLPVLKKNSNSVQMYEQTCYIYVNELVTPIINETYLVIENLVCTEIL